MFISYLLENYSLLKIANFAFDVSQFCLILFLDEVLSPTKRRRQSSEEPLTKLRSTDQPDNAVASIEKPSDDTLEKEDSNDEEEEESFDVEKIIDYAYCKESV